MDKSSPTILFGAFDRHNFGDLLFPHIVGAMLPDRTFIHAGVAERDMRPYGGHRVRALVSLAGEMKDELVNIIHVGGELLTCGAWQAAVMLQEPAQAQTIIAQLDDRPDERLHWTEAFLGMRDAVPYVVAQGVFPTARRLFNAVGGGTLDACPDVLRDEVVSKLHTAAMITVRDRHTLEQLQVAGIPARLSPDPAVMVTELFGAHVAASAQQGEVGELRRRMPQGYLAVQFSADMGDDETLGEVAEQLQRMINETGHAVVLFCAGAAPWHDELACYQRLAGRLPQDRVHVFNSLHLWDICALLANSVAYCGTSLHGRIVANAFGVPALNLYNPRAQSEKQLDYALSWPSPGLPPLVDVKEMAEKLVAALAVDRNALRTAASELAALYQQRFAMLVEALR